MSSHKKKIIDFLNRNTTIRKFSLSIYYQFFPENKLSYWISKLDHTNPINVVQIGSNDGITGDPIYKTALKRKSWNVLLVEPIPYLFERLKQNYPEEVRFTFENAAINDGTVQSFYFIKEGTLPDEINKIWYKQIGSFNKEHLKKHFNFHIEPYIQKIEISGLTLQQLLDRNEVDKLDFLHIDAEGYDWKILSQLDLDKYKPHLILFEHKHLKASEKEQALIYLKDFKIFKFTGDYLCIQKGKLTNKDLRKLQKRAVN